MASGSGLAAPVLAGSVFSQGKTELQLLRKASDKQKC